MSPSEKIGRSLGLKLLDESYVRRLAAGVASYPTHGLQADEVLARAQAALTRACAAEAGRGLGQVEVAQPDPA